MKTFPPPPHLLQLSVSVMEGVLSDILPLYLLSIGLRTADLRLDIRVPPELLTNLPLHEGLEEIRLLTAHEENFKKDIQISMHTDPLRPDNPPVYEALSHVRGSTENSTDTKIDDGNLAATIKFANARRYFRHQKKSRMPWIDAIRVNQQVVCKQS